MSAAARLGDDRPVTPHPAGGEQAAESVPHAAVPIPVQPYHPPPEQLECRVGGGRDGRRRKTRIPQHVTYERVPAARQRRATQDHLWVNAPGRREQRTQQVELSLGCRRVRWSTHEVHSSGPGVNAGSVAARAAQLPVHRRLPRAARCGAPPGPEGQPAACSARPAMSGGNAVSCWAVSPAQQAGHGASAAGSGPGRDSPSSPGSRKTKRSRSPRSCVIP